MKYIVLLVFVLGGLSMSAQADETRYIVYYFLGEECRICEYYAPEINRLDSIYGSDDIKFIGLFPNRYSTEKGISDFKLKYHISIPLKLEYFATKTKEFGVTVTPEVVVYDSLKGKMIYRGRLDDSYARVGKRRRIIKHRDLESIIQQLNDGKELEYSESVAIGCYITMR